MIEVKIDIVSDNDPSQRATMDTICITKKCIIKKGHEDYMVYGDDRSNVCSVESFKKSDGELGLIIKAIQSLIKSGNYCYINIIPEWIES